MTYIFEAFIYLFVCLFIYLFILETGEVKEKERERNMDMKEKHQSVVSLACPDQEPNLKPRHVPQPEIKQTTFHWRGLAPTY